MSVHDQGYSRNA